ncbi:MAG: PspA-associated protein PspAB [Acidimicrobiales bacterium]
MGLLDALLGRSKPVRANLDRLFALPAAAVTLQADAGLSSTHRAAACFKPATGEAFAAIEAEVAQLLGMEQGAGSGWSRSTDTYGYEWVVLTADGFEDLVTRVHMVNSSLEGSGYGPQLLCSVFGLGGDAGRTCYLVYLYKRGTFYPFAPLGGERRDNELELRLRAILSKELPVEEDISRWFPLWGLPV